MKFPHNPISRPLREGESVGGWLQRIGALNRASVGNFCKPVKVKVSELKNGQRDVINQAISNMFCQDWNTMGLIRTALADELSMYERFLASSKSTRLITLPSMPKFYCVRCLYEDAMNWQIPLHKLIWNAPSAVMCFKHNETLSEINVGRDFGLYQRIHSSFGKEELVFLRKKEAIWSPYTHYQNHLTPEAQRIATDLDLRADPSTTDLLMAIYFLISYKRNGPGPLKYLGEIYNNKYSNLKPFAELPTPDSLHLSTLSIPEKCLCYDTLAKCIGPTPANFPDRASYFNGAYSSSKLNPEEFGKFTREKPLVAFSR